MKLRDPKSIQRVAHVGSLFLRAYTRTLSFAYRPLSGTYAVNDRPDLLGPARYIYCFWHEYLIIPAYYYAFPDTSVLIGTHADGEMIAQMVQHLGLRVVRGSSTRQGTSALLRILRDGTSRHFVLTPDGPKGPRRTCQFGAVYLASRTGLPLISVGFGISRSKRLKSWDRFAIPLPFSRVRCVSGYPVHVPPDLSTAELEPYQQRLQASLNAATDVAEHWAETRTFDTLGHEPPDDVAVATRHAKAWPSARKVGHP